MSSLVFFLIVALASYSSGSIPFSYYVAKAVSGKDLTKLGTGNIGAMNVKRATDSWAWFIVAMVIDAMKGFLPVLLFQQASFFYGFDFRLAGAIAMIFSVLGHNYSLYAYYLTGKISSGRGLATSGGALLAFDWIYLLLSIIFALVVIFVTKYLLAGQIATPLFLIFFVYFTNPDDLLYIIVLAALVFIRHIPRIPGLFSGKEPKWNIKDYKQVG